MAEIKKLFKRWWFLFRWFVIGRIMCEIAARKKKYLRLLHKCFIALILFSIAYTASDIFMLMR